MKPEWFINLWIAAAIAPSTSRAQEAGSPGALANAVMGRLLKVVHGVASQQGFAFASAFPLAKMGSNPHPGNLLRVFTDSRDQADALLQALEDHALLMGYVLLDRPRPVPQQFDASVSYQLARITTRKNKNNFTRIKQLERGNLLPYVRMQSSGGQQFSLRFCVVERSSPADASCSTNGYGLSTRARPSFLPAVPVDQPPWAKAMTSQLAAQE